MKIAVDAMGGDFAPRAVVKGAILAARKYDCEITLVGDEAKVKKILEREEDYKTLKISVLHATQVIEMQEHPAKAVRAKKDSSVVVATRLVKEGICDAVVSAGSTGAAVAAAQFILGRIKGIGRPAIATPIPTPKGATLLLDSGANVDSRPPHLVQSAMMGSIYAEKVFGIKKPKVALLNIGEESTKGNEKVQTTYKLLEKIKAVNFIGNAEGRDVPKGNVDVVVCDGFVGNVVLKFGEGLAKTIAKLIKDAIKNGSIWAKLGAFLLMPTLKKMGMRLDPTEYGGAPLLGVNGCVIISHGTSNSKAICSAIRIANEFAMHKVLENIRDTVLQEEVSVNDDEGK